MDRQRVTPFAWWERDCALFAAQMADAISDGDYVKRAREAFAWTNAREALQLQRDRTLQELVESLLGPLVPWTRLGMGDMALVVDEDNRQSIAIHDGAQFIGAAENGIQRIPFVYIKGGWHVN